MTQAEKAKTENTKSKKWTLFWGISFSLFWGISFSLLWGIALIILALWNSFKPTDNKTL